MVEPPDSCRGQGCSKVLFRAVHLRLQWYTGGTQSNSARGLNFSIVNYSSSHLYAIILNGSHGLIGTAVINVDMRWNITFSSSSRRACVC